MLKIEIQLQGGCMLQCNHQCRQLKEKWPFLRSFLPGSIMKESQDWFSDRLSIGCSSTSIITA
jgi:hypothetical protein